MSQLVERPVCGAVVYGSHLLKLNAKRKGDDVVVETAGVDELFRAPLVAVDIVSLDDNSYPAWGIYGDGVLYRLTIDSEVLDRLMVSRKGNKLPTLLATDKPYTIPNGEPFSGVAS